LETKRKRKGCSKMAMRGLNVFISDIRNCRSREEEEKRVNKEIGNIRAKFKEGKLTSYDKKKYVCKMLYMYILGWEIDFGHVEAVNLITGTKYTEKQIGYLAVTLMLSENNDLLRIVINSMKNDLQSHFEIHNSLALACIANIGGREMAEALYSDVYRLLTSETSVSSVKKKAAMCLLRLFRKCPETLPASEWGNKIVSLLDDHDMGVVTSVLTLITALAQTYPSEYSSCLQKSVGLVDSLGSGQGRSDYEYYKIPAPWIQIKALRLLQCYPPPVENQALMNSIKGMLGKVIARAQDNIKPGNQANALNAIILEAINLSIHIDPESEVVKKATSLLGGFISHKETNFRYLGLETMANIALAVESLDQIKRHTDAVLQSLRDRDISVRRRGLDMLYCMCDSTNSRRIVSELLEYLATADFAIREELVLKIAILAERFATDYAWYVDVILQLIAIAGDHVSEDVWYRVVQIVTSNPDLQKYAAATVLKALKSAAAHETCVKVAGYILGEFGDLIANEPGSAPIDQFIALHSKFGICSLFTRSLLFTTYVKFANFFPEIRDEIVGIFRQYTDVLDVELQQRACEYLAIIYSTNQNLLEIVCEEMPPWEEKEESSLVSLVQKKETESTDKGLRMRAKKDSSVAVKRMSLSNFNQPGNSPNAGSGSQQAPRRPSIETSGNMTSQSHGTPPAQFQQQQSASSGLEDLLGLGLGDAAPVSNNSNSLLGDFGMTSSGAGAAGGDPNAPAPGADRFFSKLIHGNEGVLYDDNVIQIVAKTEIQGYTARVLVSYGNKSNSVIDGFSTQVGATVQGLKIQAQGVANSINIGSQIQQMFQVECSGDIPDAPSFTVSFRAAGQQKRYNLSFPIILSKFFESIQLTADDYLGRWKQIGGPPKEVQRDYKSPIAIETSTLRNWLIGMKFGVLDGIDPNPNNFVCAGIFVTSVAKIGCLLRIQIADQAFRVTVRTTSATVSESLTSLIIKKLSLPY